MRKKIRLGEMLLEQGFISYEQLQTALAEHKKSGMKLGQFLVHNNLCSEEAIVRLLSDQLRITRYEAARYPVDPDLARLVPAETARKHGVVPLERHGRVLQVATNDPLDIDALDALEIYTNLEIEPVVATEAEFEQAFTTLYGLYKGLDKVMESVEEMTSAIEVGRPREEAVDIDVNVSELESQADQAPVIKLVNSIIAQAVNEKASDIHISPEKDAVQTRFRIDGKLREVSTPPQEASAGPHLTDQDSGQHGHLGDPDSPGRPFHRGDEQA